VVPVLDGQEPPAWAGRLQLDQHHVTRPQLLGRRIQRVGDRRAADRRREYGLDIGRDADDAFAVVAPYHLAEHGRAVRTPHRIFDRAATRVGDAITWQVLVLRIPAALDVGEPDSLSAHAASPRRWC